MTPRQTTRRVPLPLALLILWLAASPARPAPDTNDTPLRYTTDMGIAYYDQLARRPTLDEAETSAYRDRRCRLDIYHPTNARGLPVVLWFHPGGLTAGQRFIPAALRDRGLVVVAADYRLSPGATYPDYVEDAAAAVAWTLENAADFGGDPARVVIAGHSAGGYLAAMVGLDKRWLAAHGHDADRLAGIVLFSGQVITHFTVRTERGIPGTRPVVDERAPLYHIRADAPPILLITGDRELEMLGRYEENAYMWRMLKVIEHPDAELVELDGYNHGNMPEGGYPLLRRFIKRVAGEE